MNIQINSLNNLNSLNSVSDNLQDINDTDAARISGGASSTFSETTTFSAMFSSDGSGRTVETFSDGDLTTSTTTTFNADGTIDGPFRSGTLPASLPARRRG